MRIQNITIGTMKFAFFFFFTLIVLLDVFHARHLHDVSIHGSLGRRPLSQAAVVIQMVTGEEEFRSPPYGCVDPKSPPSPREAPPIGQTTLGRDNPKAPPPPKVAPSRGQTTYGRDNPNSKSQTTSSEELPVIVSQKQDRLMDGIIYGRNDPAKTPPSPNPNNSRGQGMYGQDDPRSWPLSLDPNGSQGLGIFGRDNPITPPSPDPNPTPQQGMFGRDNPTTPQSPDPNDSQGQGMFGRNNPKTPPSPNPNGSRGQGKFGRVSPSPPTPSKPADVQTHPMLSVSLNSGSACNGLPTSTVDGWPRNPSQPLATAVASDDRIKSAEDH